jgi:uncharacterized protein
MAAPSQHEAGSHLPQRSCVACRKSLPKGELLRVVRTPTGEIVADPSGKISGRGAYVCPTESCLKAAAKQRKIERALGKPMTESTLAEIVAIAAQAKQ